MSVWFKEQFLETGENERGLYWKLRPTKDRGTCGGREGETINIQNNPKKLEKWDILFLTH
jgi:hypothetical protein